MATERTTKHKTLRKYLLYCARTSPARNLETFRKYTELSLKEMRRKNFYLGGVFLSRRGPYTILWIDPNTYDLLVVHREKRTASWKPMYGFFL